MAIKKIEIKEEIFEELFHEPQDFGELFHWMGLSSEMLGKGHMNIHEEEYAAYISNNANSWNYAAKWELVQDKSMHQFFLDLPKVMQQPIEEYSQDGFLMLHVDHVKVFLDDNIHGWIENDKDGYSEKSILPTVEKLFPGNVVAPLNPYVREVAPHAKMIKTELKNEILKFATETLGNETKLHINGQKIIVHPYTKEAEEKLGEYATNVKRNWAQEYYDSLNK